MARRRATDLTWWAVGQLLAIGLALPLLACDATDERSRATWTIEAITPTSTNTPVGEPLRIEGELVRAVFLPDPARGPLYALTDQALFIYEDEKWLNTGTRNDGRRLLVDPNVPERLYRGDHPPCGLSGARSEIAFEISEDGGRTWRVVESGRNVRPLAVDPSLPETIYGSDCALATSLDGGLTWNRQQIMVGFEIIAVAFVGNQMLVLGVSPEGKSRLRRIDLSDPLVPVPRETLLELPNFAFASLDAQLDRIVVGGRHSVYISDDGGATWTSSRVGLEEVTDPRDEPPTPQPGLSGRGEYGVLAVAIDPHNKHRIFAGTVRGLFVSQDDGATWDPYREVNPNQPVSMIQFGFDGADMYVTTADGVIVVPTP